MVVFIIIMPTNAIDFSQPQRWLKFWVAIKWLLVATPQFLEFCGGDA
jgi:hypothetical protein